MQNGLAAVAAATQSGIDIHDACQALATFKPTNRRLQLLFKKEDVYLYEDFAHHPTAIAATISALKCKHPTQKLIAVVEFRSNTMKQGCHGDQLGGAFNQAETTFIYQPEQLKWNPESLESESKLKVCSDKHEIIDQLDLRNIENSVIICMSNGSFDALPEILRERLETLFVESKQ